MRVIVELILLPRWVGVVCLLLLASSCGGEKMSPALSPADAQAKQQAESQRLGLPDTMTDSIGIRLALIPAGEFTMGSPANEAGRQPKETLHKVTLTGSFYLATTEVTQAQWTALMEKNPSFVEGDDHPVETINWKEATEFCRRLTEKEGARYRLPTEAEWEYACRAGTTTAFHTGPSLSTEQANFNGELDDPQQGLFRDETTAVASFAPNAWGLYDMHGNVWEWCADWHSDYDVAASIDPHGPDAGTTRVVRGGCWVNPAKVCRSASRGDTDPGNWNFNFGFRVVRELD